MNLNEIRTPCVDAPFPFEEAFHIGYQRPGPEARAVIRECKAICGTCPAKLACLEMALDAESGEALSMRHGIFGGCTPPERYRLNGGRVRPQSSAPHGTDARYKRHLADAETPCRDCTDAHTAAGRASEDKRRAKAKSEIASGTLRGLSGRRVS